MTILPKLFFLNDFNTTYKDLVYQILLEKYEPKNQVNYNTEIKNTSRIESITCLSLLLGQSAPKYTQIDSP